jgi:uncharacterized protein DUF4282
MSYPAPPPASPPPATSSQSPAPSAGGFFNDLFDIRFTRFVSLRLISVVYVLILVLVSLSALALIFTGFASGAGPGLFALVFAVLGWFIYVVLSRVLLEAFAVLFRIHDDTTRVADALAGGARPAPGAGSSTGGTAPVSPYDPGYGSTQAYPAPGYGTTPPSSPPAPPSDPSSPPWS